MNRKKTFDYQDCPLQNEEAEFILHWVSPGVLGTTHRQWKVEAVDCALRDQDMCPDENGLCETLLSYYGKISS